MVAVLKRDACCARPRGARARTRQNAPTHHEHHHPRRLPGRGAQAALRRKLEPYNAKVFTNTVKGIGQLSVRLRDADVLVLIRERTQFPRALLEKLPRLKLISQTGRSARTSTSRPAPAGHRGGRRRGLAGGAGRADLGADHGRDAAAAAVHRQPQARRLAAVGLKAASMPPNFGIGMVLRGKTLGIWGYGKIGQLVAGYGRAFGMQVLVWGSEASRAARGGRRPRRAAASARPSSRAATC
jgi:D-3-phosphoglycerate dehydrogenase / 2-oxoglutarate reductase